MKMYILGLVPGLLLASLLPVVGQEAGSARMDLPRDAGPAFIQNAPVDQRLAMWRSLPGEFAIRTLRGFYLTAINGGGRNTSPTVVTVATTAGPWEKFKLNVLDSSPPNDKNLQTANGNYVTAVSGGGRGADALHTDANQAQAWEQFRIYDLSSGGVAPTYFALQSIFGNYLTAVGEGGKYENAIHTDATSIGQWEYLRIVKCGDLGTEQQYTIIPADEQVLTAVNSGGLNNADPIVRGYWPGDTPDRQWARFKLIRQSDGSYALQTANGVNYVTALGGGGHVQQYFPPDCGWYGACLASFSRIFHTDATQALSWERFRFVDLGNCKYTIQTSSGFYMGIFKDSSGTTLLSTRRSTVTENETFQLVMYGLASPLVLR
jgi:hypothetical protein